MIRILPYRFECNDGSILYEWIHRTWRFGISIAGEPAESSWYFVSKFGVNGNGYLSSIWAGWIRFHRRISDSSRHI